MYGYKKERDGLIRFIFGNNGFSLQKKEGNKLDEK
jgi:hypothetical protein